jgi:hypothetical protein
MRFQAGDLDSCRSLLENAAEEGWLVLPAHSRGRPVRAHPEDEGRSCATIPVVTPLRDRSGLADDGLRSLESQPDGLDTLPT